MNACHQLCNQLADLAFSSQTTETIVEKATLLLRHSIETIPSNPIMPANGVKPGLLYCSQSAIKSRPLPGARIQRPENFEAGHLVGLALGQAIKKQIDKPTLRRRLGKILCES